MSVAQEADAPVVKASGDVERAGRMWDAGLNTFDIAYALCIHEASALWLVGRYRDFKRGSHLMRADHRCGFGPFLGFPNVARSAAICARMFGEYGGGL